MGSYLAFIWQEKANRAYLLCAAALCVIQFAIFKLLYPFPDFFNDSYWYIFAASEGLDINIWPIGYSKFLAAFHLLTHSDTALVAFQYFFMQLAALHFFFTLLYFFKTSRWSRNVLFTFFFINPLTLYLSNTVSSDILFGALTLLWLTELIRVIRQPRHYQLLTNALLVFLCFTIRHAGSYYLFVSALGFVLSNQAIWRKIMGVGLPIILLIPFVLHSEKVAYSMTGSRQYSLLTGWQLANNALYTYNHVHVDSAQLPTPVAREINRMAIQFFNETNPGIYDPGLNPEASNFFIVGDGPLIQYFYAHKRGVGNLSTVREWGRVSALFAPFGKYIIRHDPMAYVRYYALPNAWQYLKPPLSDLKRYNGGRDKVDSLAVAWFEYPGRTVYCVSHNWQGYMYAYSVLFLLLNFFVFGQMMFLIIKFRRLDKRDFLLHSFLMAYLFINFIFSIIATNNMLRYQYIPLFVLLSVTVLISKNLSQTGNGNPPEAIAAGRR